MHGNTEHGHATRHAGTSRTYNSWSGMLQRCLNPNNPRYIDYGGRGIWVCKEWGNFQVFLEDMGECLDGFVIDRINNEDGYHKSNCKWVTYEVSAQNKRVYKNNSSGVSGVVWSARKGKWQVYACQNKRTIHLGYRRTLEEAIALRRSYVG